MFWLLMVPQASAATTPQQPPASAPGIAWQVEGSWQVFGKAGVISTADAIVPGELLHPVEGSPNHSILILLPDGQRILYECYAHQDCSRNFRVPELTRKPDLFAVDLLARIRAVRVDGRFDLASRADESRAIPREETVSVLGPENRAQVAGLAAALPDGDYTCAVRAFSPAVLRQDRCRIDKTSPAIALPLPARGLYDVTIYDSLNTPRINLLIAAVSPEQKATLGKPFEKASALMKDWNEDYQGWPIHEFQRAYLESLVLGIKPRNPLVTAGRTVDANRPGVTAEPAFSPEPGLLKGDTEVRLNCRTPGAVMHFTVDGSQPLNSSPVYRAPIVVMGTGLTIKAFATAAGKQDSAVVTGMFRIGD